MMNKARVRQVVAGILSIALIGALGISQASAATAPVVTGSGTGPQPPGQGLGSKAALAQASCAANGHTSLALEGSGPFCVNPWPAGKNNGGATAPGVTATSVKVILYIENDQQAASGANSAPPRDQATGMTASRQDAIRDAETAYAYAQKTLHTFQTWGRTIDFETVVATGSDETSQRADAVAIAAKKPFIVCDLTGFATGGAGVLASALALKKIVVFSASTTPQIARQQNPYRWGTSVDNTAAIPLTAAFVGRSLAGEKAKWAGDKSLAAKTRSFGVVYPTSSDFDFASLQPQLTKNGGPKLAAAVGYDPTSAAQTADQVATYVSKLKDSGATSVILFAPGPVITPIMAVATQQDYHPEWIFTGYGYQEYDSFARTYDQDQMRHAFGMSVLFPFADPQGLHIQPFQWYWGTKAGVNAPILAPLVETMYATIHYAGPTLTAANVHKGWFSVPATGGTATFSRQGYGNTVGMPYPEYSATGTDRSLAWWDADTSGPTQAVNGNDKGVFQYMDGGKRYGYTNMPTKEPTFFDPKGTVVQVPYGANYPGGVVPPASPCVGCPSSG